MEKSETILYTFEDTVTDQRTGGREVAELEMLRSSGSRKDGLSVYNLFRHSIN